MNIYFLDGTKVRPSGYLSYARVRSKKKISASSIYDYRTKADILYDQAYYARKSGDEEKALSLESQAAEYDTIAGNILERYENDNFIWWFERRKQRACLIEEARAKVADALITIKHQSEEVAEERDTLSQTIDNIKQNYPECF